MSRPIASSSRLITRQLSLPTTRQSSSSPWPSRTHLKKPSTIPLPLTPMYAQKIVLSDGSTFTTHTTAPTPSIIRLTRDVTNNPLWAPGTDKRGVGDGIEEGRVGRFRRRFGGSDDNVVGNAEVEFEGIQEEGGKENDTDMGSTTTSKQEEAFGLSDFDWMSEGAKEETLGAKDIAGKGKAAKKK